MPLKPLATAKLYRRCNAKSLGFKTTRDLQPVKGLIGQDRALDALEFGSPAEQLGLDFDWEILSLETRADRLPAQLVYLPAGALLALVGWIQMGRRRREAALAPASA